MRAWNYDFEVSDTKKVRMIVHTDCKNEADDQFALAHHVMTPGFIMKGIVAGHFNRVPQNIAPGETAKASLTEVKKILKLMDMEGICPVEKGAEYPLTDEQVPNPSKGAELIIREALREDPHPLFIACQGTLTDLAAAILMEPAICGRMTAIWIGGGAYPKGGQEFNLYQDTAAANVVFKSEMPLWQIPVNVYKQLGVSLAEVQHRVKPCGEIGEYLFRNMAKYNMSRPEGIWPHGEVWGLGDSAGISVLLEERERTDLYEMIAAPGIHAEDMTYIHDGSNREIRVYHHINARLTLEDFYAKLWENYGGER